MSQPPRGPRGPTGPPRGPHTITLPEEPPSEPLSPQQARERAAYIRTMVQRIEQYQRAAVTDDEIARRVPEFKKEYPKLYDTLLHPGAYPTASIQTMLAMLDRMGSGQLSQHNASMIVGQRAFDTIVRPQLDAAGSHPPR